MKATQYGARGGAGREGEKKEVRAWHGREAPTPENTYVCPIMVKGCRRKEKKEKKHPVAVRQLQQI